MDMQTGDPEEILCHVTHWPVTYCDEEKEASYMADYILKLHLCPVGGWCASAVVFSVSAQGIADSRKLCKIQRAGRPPLSAAAPQSMEWWRGECPMGP